jgi:hypothetical protein
MLGNDHDAKRIESKMTRRKIFLCCRSHCGPLVHACRSKDLGRHSQGNVVAVEPGQGIWWEMLQHLQLYSMVSQRPLGLLALSARLVLSVTAAEHATRRRLCSRERRCIWTGRVGCYYVENYGRISDPREKAMRLDV